MDYIGFTAALRKALGFYTDSKGKGELYHQQEKTVQLMLEKLEVVRGFYENFDYHGYFAANTYDKLHIILEAQEHVISPDKQMSQKEKKAEYITQVKALSEAFALSIPDPEALEVKDEVGFFQAVKSRLVKFEDRGSKRSRHEIESAIRDVVDKAIQSTEVVDIFEAAGIAKPEISILSDEFLNGVKSHPQKNLAIELLRKLLKDEIKTRARTNIIKSQKLLEILTSIIKRYQNNLLTAAEVIEEMIKLARDIRQQDARGEAMGLEPEELAFYDALADNKSARDVLGDERLRDLAMVLFDRVRSNASLYWELKESVRAKMRVAIKRFLRKYGYPPDKQAIATENILKQAENFAHLAQETQQATG